MDEYADMVGHTNRRSVQSKPFSDSKSVRLLRRQLLHVNGVPNRGAAAMRVQLRGAAAGSDTIDPWQSAEYIARAESCVKRVQDWPFVVENATACPLPV